MNAGLVLNQGTRGYARPDQPFAGEPVHLHHLRRLDVATAQWIKRLECESPTTAKLAPDWHQFHPENKKVSRR